MALALCLAHAPCPACFMSMPTVYSLFCRDRK